MSTASFTVPLVINSVIALIAWLVFCKIRSGKPHIYQPRVKLCPQRNIKPLPAGFFSWIRPLLQVTDDEYFEQAGLDALMYTLFFRMGLKLSVFCSIFGIIVLMPVNATTDEFLLDDNTTVSGIDTISLSHVDEESDRMWAHWFATYLFGLAALYLIHGVYKEYIKYRIRYLQQKHPYQRTVLVRDIPEDFQNNEAFKEKFSRMYDDVTATHVAQDVPDLRKALALRQKICWKLEHTKGAIATLKEGKDRPQARDGGFLCCGGQKVDAEEHWTAKLAEQNEEVGKLMDEANGEPKFTSAGFVTFDSLSSAATAMQSNHAKEPATWDVSPASEPHDVCWANLAMGFWARLIRSSLFGVATVALVILWVIPVSFVASLTTLEALSENLSFLDGVNDLPAVVVGFLEGFLPTLALIIFMAILPMIMLAFAKGQGIPFISAIHISALQKLFLFQVVNVFFVSIIAGSLFEDTSAITDDPVGLLGNSIPKTGIFFTNYVMIQSMIGFPIQMLQLGTLIVSWIKHKFLCKTKREFDLALAPKPFQYFKLAPRHLLVFLIGLTYAVISPIILPFLVIFFGSGYITYRYSLLYVHMPLFESGGAMWPRMFNRVMVGVLLSQIVVLGVLGVKKAAIASPLIIPMLFITIVFWRHMNSVFEKVPLYIPRSDAVDADKGELEGTKDDNSAQKQGDLEQGGDQGEADHTDDFKNAELREPRTLEADEYEEWVNMHLEDAPQPRPNQTSDKDKPSATRDESRSPILEDDAAQQQEPQQQDDEDEDSKKDDNEAKDETQKTQDSLDAQHEFE
eukprot:m.79523 g.79523  ORF g.79523 m.79523 type:complete len:798 (+) comp20860_c0_seq3:205-2598(+)